MSVLFLIIFVDFLGFSMLIPSFQYYGIGLGGTAALVTAIGAMYPVGQFIGSPFWGRLSDRIGRKPVLIVCMSASVPVYLMMAFWPSLIALFIGRLVGGMLAGNIAAAQAYVADVTPPKDRAKALGRVTGMAIGLAFVIGPAVGGLLGGADAATANIFWPSILAAALSAIAALLTALVLKESRTDDPQPNRQAIQRTGRLLAFRQILKQPVLPILIFAGAVFIFSSALMETIYPLFSEARFGWGPREIGLQFTAIGVLLVVVQGGLIGPLSRTLGEVRLVIIGCALLTTGLVVIGISTSWPAAATGIAIGAFGSAIFSAPLSSLISRNANPNEQGLVMGVHQSMQGLGRSGGPLISGVLFDTLGVASPMFLGAIAAFGIFVTLALTRDKLSHPKD